MTETTTTTTTTTETMNNPQIAATIRSQFGRVAAMMTGANTFIDHGNGLSFRFKGSRKANYCKITLDASDTYTVEFKKCGRAPRFTVKNVANFSGVYADMMHDLFTNTTGLLTSF